MAAPLYSRYVPPKSASRTKEPTEIVVDKEAAQPTITASPQLYRRYVPSKASNQTIATTYPTSPSTNTPVTQISSLTINSEDRTPSKKRKRTKEGIAQSDEKNLAKHRASTESNSVDRSTEDSVYAKGRKGKSDKAHKTRKLEEIESQSKVQTDDEQFNATEDQKINPENADSVLAAYNNTGGSYRESLNDARKVKSEQDQEDQTDEDLANEPAILEDQMDADLTDEDLHNENADEEEELTKAGAEAILQKYRRTTQRAGAKQAKGKSGQEPKDPAEAVEELELHGLEPLPQPAKTPKAPYEPNFDSLPSWLAKPIMVSPTTSVPFAELSLSSNILDNLHRKNYRNALAVQSSVLNLLLPGPHKHRGDICVSAPTGSGKTLAYMLPVVQNLKQKVVTRLRALIIVPTRELVAQAQEVAQICASGTGVKVGAAVGNISLAAEQETLVRKGQKYDPKAAQTMHQEARERLQFGYGVDDALLQNVTNLLPDHVPEYSSKIDLLICTPGRLVDHIRSTVGFSLHNVEWLVIDEADKLLDETFQDWVEVLLHALHPSKSSTTMSALHKVLGNLNFKVPQRNIQKVILSATMTRDLSKLASLKFKSPCLVVVATEPSLDVQPPGTEIDAPKLKLNGQNFELPVSLTEFGITVWDVADKPLYLMKLLQDKIIVPSVRTIGKRSTSNLDSDSDTGSNSDTNSSSDSGPETTSESTDITTLQESVLIFTRDNENATRLGHLLSILHPPFKSIMSTLTKSSATSDGRKILKAFRAGRVKILISSDRASRGLDIENLSHVINYDIPRNVTSYIHRVGRTARAGKEGKAWTLFTRRESKWFWEAVGGDREITRTGRSVEKMIVNVEKLDGDTRQRYQDALEELQAAVHGKQ